MDTITTQHLIVMGLLLAILTPTITAAIKKYAKNIKALSALMPVILTAIAWMVDSLVSGVSPLGPEGMEVLIAALSGSLAGAKARDVVKHTLNKAA